MNRLQFYQHQHPHQQQLHQRVVLCNPQEHSPVKIEKNNRKPVLEKKEVKPQAREINNIDCGGDDSTAFTSLDDQDPSLMESSSVSTISERQGISSTPAAAAAATLRDKTKQNKGLKKSVSFDSMVVKEYPIIPGINPAVTLGVPLTIDWQPLDETIICSVDEYQESRPPPRTMVELRMPASYRYELLRRLGYSRNELLQHAKHATIVRNQRRQTDATLHLQQTQEALERSFRAVRNVTWNRAEKAKEKELLKGYLNSSEHDTAASSSTYRYPSSATFKVERSLELAKKNKEIASSTGVGMTDSNVRTADANVTASPSLDDTGTAPVARFSSASPLGRKAGVGDGGGVRKPLLSPRQSSPSTKNKAKCEISSLPFTFEEEEEHQASSQTQLEDDNDGEASITLFEAVEGNPFSLQSEADDDQVPEEKRRRPVPLQKRTVFRSRRKVNARRIDQSASVHEDSKLGASWRSSNSDYINSLGASWRSINSEGAAVPSRSDGNRTEVSKKKKTKRTRGNAARGRLVLSREYSLGSL
jgi:hypothetical protein